MVQLVDYAWTKPTPAAIAAGGYAGVLRYLSYDSGKNLTAGERDALLAAGLSIGLVWETTATRANQGYAAGQQDVQAAEGQARALGYPAGCPIFYAVDYDAPVSAVLPYFQGVQGLAHWPVGVYGSANIIEGVPVPWKWQTTAWSHGRISPQAHIFQTLLPSLPACDLNNVLRPLPLWSRSGGPGGIASGTVSIPGAPTFPTNTPAQPSQEDDMQFTTFNLSDGTKDVAVVGRYGAVVGVFASGEELQCVMATTAANPGVINTRQMDLYHAWYERANGTDTIDAQLAQIGAAAAALVVAEKAAASATTTALA